MDSPPAREKKKDSVGLFIFFSCGQTIKSCDLIELVQTAIKLYDLIVCS